jgi:hypothetical protein
MDIHEKLAALEAEVQAYKQEKETKLKANRIRVRKATQKKAGMGYKHFSTMLKPGVYESLIALRAATSDDLGQEITTPELIERLIDLGNRALSDSVAAEKVEQSPLIEAKKEIQQSEAIIMELDKISSQINAVPAAEQSVAVVSERIDTVLGSGSSVPVSYNNEPVSKPKTTKVQKKSKSIASLTEPEEFIIPATWSKPEEIQLMSNEADRMRALGIIATGLKKEDKTYAQITEYMSNMGYVSATGKKLSLATVQKLVEKATKNNISM